MRERFSQNIIIKPEDIDQLGHVNNIVYLKWVQDVAIAHWSTLAHKDIQEKYFWVVVRHEIDYLSSAYLNSQLQAVTWIGGYSGAKSDRFVTIVDIATNKTIASVKTTWCMINAVNHRPARIESDVADLFIRKG